MLDDIKRASLAPRVGRLCCTCRSPPATVYLTESLIFAIAICIPATHAPYIFLSMSAGSATFGQRPFDRRTFHRRINCLDEDLSTNTLSTSCQGCLVGVGQMLSRQNVFRRNDVEPSQWQNFFSSFKIALEPRHVLSASVLGSNNQNKVVRLSMADSM